MKAIVARSKNNVIGYKNSLPWKSKEDMAFFKEKTENNIVIMGRNTYESLPQGGLRNRKIFVLSSRDSGMVYIKSQMNCTAQFFKSIDSLINKVKIVENGGEECWVAGGQTVYQQLLPYCTEVFVTEFDFEVEGDTLLTSLEGFEKQEKIKDIPNGTIIKYFK